MSYQEALDYLYSFPNSELKLPTTPAEFNLPLTVALLDTFGNPHYAFRSVVIAGTKGKGSTAVLIEAIARAAGLRTGLWTSPHLHSYRERIQVDRRPIEREAFVQAIEEAKPLLEATEQRSSSKPTIFMIGFGIALRYFATCAVDLAILEIGVGGRYDSANAVTPILSVITSISYDHMHILGDTLSQIAFEKAGIMRQGVPAITTAQQPEAMQTLCQVATEIGTSLYVAAEHLPANQSLAHTLPCPIALDLFGRYKGPTITALQGSFQRENARLAIGAALLLRDYGLPITDQAIAAGLATAQWPGRMEIVDGSPPIVLDGAHNGDSARRLVESLGELFPNRRIVLVLGTSKDKDLPRILAELIPAAAAVVLTHSWHPRALTDLEQLAETIGQYLPAGHHIPIALTSDIPQALDQARILAHPNDLICVTGSLFVVAAARETLGLAEHD